MVDDSIDVDKLLIRTWHAFPADLREERGVTHGSRWKMTWTTRGFEKERAGHGSQRKMI